MLLGSCVTKGLYPIIKKSGGGVYGLWLMDLRYAVRNA